MNKLLIDIINLYNIYLLWEDIHVLEKIENLKNQEDFIKKEFIKKNHIEGNLKKEYKEFYMDKQKLNLK